MPPSFFVPHFCAARTKYQILTSKYAFKQGKAYTKMKRYEKPVFQYNCELSAPEPVGSQKR
jgi:hypothetical protein